jgi:hypothetical protein
LRQIDKSWHGGNGTRDDLFEVVCEQSRKRRKLRADGGMVRV